MSNGAVRSSVRTTRVSTKSQSTRSCSISSCYRLRRTGPKKRRPRMGCTRTGCMWRALAGTRVPNSWRRAAPRYSTAPSHSVPASRERRLRRFNVLYRRKRRGCHPFFADVHAGVVLTGARYVVAADPACGAEPGTSLRVSSVPHGAQLPGPVRSVLGWMRAEVQRRLPA
jgi:hypothetical protein